MNIARIPVHSSIEILPAVIRLLRLRYTISVNNFRHSKLISKVFTILAMVGFLVLAGIVYWFTRQMIGFVHSPQFIQSVGDPITMLDSIPALFFTFFTLAIFFPCFALLLQALYLAGDMDFLVAAPIPMRAVFITKLLQAIVIPFGLGIVFGLPILYSLGSARGYNILYYAAVPLMMIALSLMAAGLAGILVMSVVRIFPYQRVAEVLGFFGAVLSFSLSQTGNLINATRSSSVTTIDQIVSALGYLSHFNNPLIMLNWPGEGLVALGTGAWLSGVGMTVLCLAISIGIFSFSLQTAERWYYIGWAGMQVVPMKKRPAHSVSQAVSPLLEKLNSLVMRAISAPVLGLFRKDILVLRRDLRHLSQLVTPLIFGVMYGILFLVGRNQPSVANAAAPAWLGGTFPNMLSFGNISLALMVGWMLLARLASMGFSSEGKNYWMLKAAPVSARQMLTAKFMVAYLPSLCLSVGFLAVFSLLQKVPLATAAYSTLALTMSLAGMAGILLAFGVAGANFNWDDPRRNSAGKVGSLGAVLSMVYLPIVLGLFIGPLALVTYAAFPVGFAYLTGGFLGSVAGLAGMLLPLHFAIPLVNRLDES